MRAGKGGNCGKTGKGGLENETCPEEVQGHRRKKKKRTLRVSIGEAETCTALKSPRAGEGGGKKGARERTNRKHT